MKIVIGTLLSTVAILILVTTTNAIAQTRSNGIQDRFAEVNGLRLHYLVPGTVVQ